MLSTLNEWSTRCVSTLADLEKQIASIKADALKRHREEQEWAAHVEKLIEAKPSDSTKNESGGILSGLGRRLGAGAASKRGSQGMDGEDDDDMDVDDDDDAEDRRGTRSAKKRGFGGLGFGK
jgi:COP9 signalosome complex subunit 7